MRPPPPGARSIDDLLGQVRSRIERVQPGEVAARVAAGALRGLRDTRVPMLLAGLGYWVIGLPVGLVLGFPLGFGVGGVWIGLATGLAVVAALMLRRWWRLAAAADEGWFK